MQAKYVDMGNSQILCFVGVNVNEYSFSHRYLATKALEKTIYVNAPVLLLGFILRKWESICRNIH